MFPLELKMNNLSENPGADSRQYDLAERTARFGEDVIRFLRQLPKDVITEPLIKQLVRSSTSIGANYTEANNAESQREFRHKIGISRKEAGETKYWLRMIAIAVPEMVSEARVLWIEAKQLHLILVTIFRKQTLILKQNQGRRTNKREQTVSQSVETGRSVTATDTNTAKDS